MNPDLKEIDDLLYKIEVESNPALESEDWLLIIEALESYKEMITNNG